MPPKSKKVTDPIEALTLQTRREKIRLILSEIQPELLSSDADDDVDGDEENCETPIEVMPIETKPFTPPPAKRGRGRPPRTQAQIEALGLARQSALKKRRVKD